MIEGKKMEKLQMLVNWYKVINYKVALKMI